MTAWDWIIGCVGRADSGVIYDGMSPRNRRIPRKRTEYFEASRALNEKEFWRYVEKRKTARDYELPYYTHLFLKFLYKNPEGDLKKYNPAVEERVIYGALGTFHISSFFYRKEWMAETLPSLAEDRILPELLPALFDDRFIDMWEKAHAAEKIAYKEQIEKDRQREAVNAPIKEKISNLQDQLGRLNSMFHNSQGADQMTRYQLVISIESTENAISQLRSMLK